MKLADLQASLQAAEAQRLARIEAKTLRLVPDLGYKTFSNLKGLGLLGSVNPHGVEARRQFELAIQAEPPFYLRWFINRTAWSTKKYHAGLLFVQATIKQVLLAQEDPQIEALREQLAREIMRLDRMPTGWDDIDVRQGRTMPVAPQLQERDAEFTIPDPSDALLVQSTSYFGPPTK